MYDRLLKDEKTDLGEMIPNRQVTQNVMLKTVIFSPSLFKQLIASYVCQRKVLYTMKFTKSGSLR